MNYTQYSDHLKLCQYLGKEPEGEYKEFYDFITEVWKDMEFIVINEHNKQGILFHKGTEFYMEQDFKNGWLWCDYDRVWSFFINKKVIEVSDTQDFIRGMVEEHLKSQVQTPILEYGAAVAAVEKHLKSQVQTPLPCDGGGHGRVEEHLKSQVSTPPKPTKVHSGPVKEHLKCMNIPKNNL
jgi:hypothetical protein